ncbi:MAG: ABC transporter substrate-binding protein [Clostridium sp.]|nr:ABC transporter substrate-binding protein [Clostridium sp.]
MKKYLSALLLTAAFVFCLSGCGKDGLGTEDKREQVTVAFWGDQLTEQYGEYLRDTFPEVDFTFYVATNSTDFYRFKERQGDLPDILTVRRFALRDVVDWKDALMDLSDTELANTFPQTYLRSYTYDDGTVNWLPACAEVDSIIINKTLLEENGISIPTNYGEFVSACGQLEELGIRPFASNFAADYTCMEILQGLSAQILTSQEGREWRQRYESGQTNQLDEEVWLPIFERMREFIDYSGVTSADMESGLNVFDDYTAGKTAMVRGLGDEAARYSEAGRETVLMPYYGETEEENWYLTYPSFQIAVSVSAQESPERERLILDIMEAMLGEEGLRKISANQNMVPYNSGVTIDLSPAMSGIQPYIDSNRLYIRLASADMFSISKQVVQGMILGEYPDARSAFDAFNEALLEEKEAEPVAAHIETGYSYAFDPEGGSPAASAVMNSVREIVGTQLLIGPAASVAGNIAAGDYTAEELRFLTMGEEPSVLLCEMTGEQVYRYMDYMLTAQGKRGSVINDSTLYVSSGFEMAVWKTEEGYELEKLTIGGEELDREAVYSVAAIGHATLMLDEAMETAGVAEYTKLENSYKELVAEYLADGGQLKEPTDYITLKRR